MADTSVKKVQAAHSPRGEKHQKYLASGTRVAMRLWEDEPPGNVGPKARRDYETVGYVIKGRAELHLEGQKVSLEPGDCWVVPRDAVHHYEVLESFTAVEATSPPARVHCRESASDA